MKSPGKLLRKGGSILLEACVWVVVLIFCIPIYLLFMIGLKTQQDFNASPYALPDPVALDNVAQSWKQMKMPTPIINSFLIAAGAVALVVIISGIASYALARSQRAWTKYIYIYFLLGLMINFYMIMIPLYKMMTDLKLTRSLLGIILVYISQYMGFSTMMFTGFIRSVPRELDEAATIDGAGKMCIFFSIIMPLLKPAIVSVIVFCSTWIWNDLLMPLLFLGRKYTTIITALYSFKGQDYTTNWTMVFAGSTVTILPLLILFLCFQQYFIKGMAAAAVKG
jgi:raffinose/stachyose/melibiose transport system permease protein